VIAATEGADAVVHLGFREPMDPSRLARLVADQQVGPLLASLNTVPVAAGDTVLVPFAAGPGEVRGPLEAVRCLPPLPEPGP
jgi:hypothetical protein